MKIKPELRARSGCSGVRAPQSSPQKPAGIPTGAEFPSLAFPEHQRMLRPKEIAVRLGCNVRHVHDLIASGRLRAINISDRHTPNGRRRYRIPCEAWRAYVRENTV